MEARKLLYITPDGGPDLAEPLSRAGWEVQRSPDLGTATRRLREPGFHVGLLLIETIDDETCAALHDFLQRHNTMEWVGVFGSGCFESQNCSELILNHFFDFHTLPVDVERLLPVLGHAYGRARLWAKTHGHDRPACSNAIVGNSLAIKKLLRQINKVASVDAPVMISGASGSGKELAAQAIHSNSARAGGPFVAVNCSALPSSLIQSELFGYEKGAFTGAAKAKQGFIERAMGGTVFLDEIGDLPIDLQTNLLRFLQEKTINRVGSTQNILVDVRVVAASHVNLEQAVTSGNFRADLYYRLNVLPLTVPALRERKEDIMLLARHFFEMFSQEKNPRIKGFSNSAISAMETHDWPGNVRELLNRIRRAMVMAEGRLITRGDLGLERRTAPRDQLALEEARASAEKNAIQITLQHAGNNITHAAKELGVSRMTLYRLLEKHRIHS